MRHRVGHLKVLVLQQIADTAILLQAKKIYFFPQINLDHFFLFLMLNHMHLSQLGEQEKILVPLR